MNRSKALLGAAPAFALSVLLIAGCAGPPIPGDVSGEPVCPDFEVGASRQKFQGGLRYPILVTIKEGSAVQAKALVLGRRNESDAPTRFLLPDDSSEYSVEWAQCANERAPRSATTGASAKEKPKADAAHYECGDAKPYKTDKLITRKHVPGSHAVTFATPPNAACWTAEGPSSKAADAGTPDAAPDNAGSTDAAPATAIEDAGSDASAASTADADAAAGLTEEQAIERARKAARKAGRDPERYKAPRVKRTASGAAYVVHFDPKERPGDPFAVMVNITSGDAKLMATQ